MIFPLIFPIVVYILLIVSLLFFGYLFRICFPPGLNSFPYLFRIIFTVLLVVLAELIPIPASIKSIFTQLAASFGDSSNWLNFNRGTAQSAGASFRPIDHAATSYFMIIIRGPLPELFFFCAARTRPLLSACLRPTQAP